MKVLVINCGSSSLKYQLLETETETVLVKGLCDRIGLPHSFIKYAMDDEDSVQVEKTLGNHRDAIQAVLETIPPEIKIEAVGHRVVHAAERYSDAVVIDKEVINALKECIPLAPLHNPPNIVGIEACQAVLPGIPMVAVFDTAFHQTLPAKTYLYALPYDWYRRHRIRKYGFHGTSHKYVAGRAAEILGRPIEELKIISCHLGNGASVCAIKGGISVDTSMGFTPLEGLAMGTRCGDIDAAIIKYIMETENMTLDEVDVILNKRSGVLGISGVSSDFRDITKGYYEGDKRCILAIEIFCDRVKKHIAQYAAIMGGVDAIVFTAGIGENNPLVRQKSIEGLEFVNIGLDEEKNNATYGTECDLTKAGMRVRTLVIPTNEELAIAQETAKLLDK